MIGVFDSGRGGLAAACSIRRTMPFADIVYLADRENAPYGTKSREQLVFLVCEDIRRLLEIGAEKILIACCTASTVYDLLPERYKAVSVPIVQPTAKAAANLTKGSVSVFATEATVKSGAFEREIKNEVIDCAVKEIPAQNLVKLVEFGADTDKILKEVKKLCENLPSETDTVILGCTHFSFAREQFALCLGADVRIVDAAAVGANCIINKKIGASGNARCIYI